MLRLGSLLTIRKYYYYYYYDHQYVVACSTYFRIL